MADTTPTTQVSPAPVPQAGPDLVAITARIDELAKQNKILADTLAATKPVDELAIAAKASESAKAAALGELDVRAATAAATAKKTAARQAVLEGTLKEVFAKVPELEQLPDSDDPAVLDAAAQKILARAKELKLVVPDVGGATKDGGAVPAAGTPATPAKFAGLTPGLARFAGGLKLPA
jgi:hypothetical protein